MVAPHVFSDTFYFRKFKVKAGLAILAMQMFPIWKYVRGMRMEWLRKEMALRGVSQKDIGIAAGLSEGQISKVMNGTRRLTADEAAAIWRHLGYAMPDEDATDVDLRILQLLTRLTEDEKIALEQLLKRGG